MLYYNFIDLIDSNEKSKNMFLKSKISIKINYFGDNKDISLKEFSNICAYAKKRNVFIWISCLYDTTLVEEYNIYNILHEKFNNVGITLSCSHSSISEKVDKILKNNGHIRLVKGLYKGDISNHFIINRLYIDNAKKLCNSINYQCLATHDFKILNQLDLNKNKNLELSFYFRNMVYAQTNLIKHNISVDNISMYVVYGNKLLSIYDKRIKLPYYHKKKILFNPFHKMIY